MAKNLGLDLGDAPEKKTIKASTNTQKREAGGLTDLNFKVSPEFKREFKVWAAAHDLTQKETLERAFRLLKQNV